MTLPRDQYHRCFLLKLIAAATACSQHTPREHVFPVIDPATSEKVIRKRRHKFVLDSGATVHCVNDISLFTHIDHDSPCPSLQVADGHFVKAKAVGTVKISLQDHKGTPYDLILHNVCYLPDFPTNLISIRRLWKDNRIKTKFGERNLLVDSHTHSKISFDGGHEYKLTAFKIRKASEPHMSTHTKLPYSLIHSRFGHCSHKRLHRTKEHTHNFPDGDTSKPDPHSCDACEAGAMKRKPFPASKGQKFTYFGERLSSDLCGPFPKSIDKCKYALVIVDACTKIAFVYNMKSKSSEEVREGFEAFKPF